jgi:hypothetical protein
VGAARELVGWLTGETPTRAHVLDARQLRGPSGDALPVHAWTVDACFCGAGEAPRCPCARLRALVEAPPGVGAWRATLAGPVEPLGSASESDVRLLVHAQPWG